MTMVLIDSRRTHHIYFDHFQLLSSLIMLLLTVESTFPSYRLI